MPTNTWEILRDGNRSRVVADLDGRELRIGIEELGAVTGWELKPQGLCRGGVCVPVRERTDLVTGDQVALGRVAARVGSAFVLDPEERIAVLGASPRERGERLASLEAPEFALPALDGSVHSLSGFRGKKVLLIAWASW